MKSFEAGSRPWNVKCIVHNTEVMKDLETGGKPHFFLKLPLGALLWRLPVLELSFGDLPGVPPPPTTAHQRHLRLTVPLPDQKTTG